jgi:DNA-binding transcriptional MerR regulator
MDKAPDAFRTISEVAEDLDLPQHVLRFWETRFGQIKPMKRGGGRRYYRPDDVDLLRGIRHLLYGEGYTIRGVQRILKDNGIKFVQSVWKSGAPQPGPPQGDDETDAEETVDSFDASDVDMDAEEDASTPVAPPVRPEPLPLRYARATPATLPLGEGRDTTEAVMSRGATEPHATPTAVKAEPSMAAAPRARLAAAEREMLQTALRELGECKRILEEAMKESA